MTVAEFQAEAGSTDTTGWYIARYRVPTGMTDAGQVCWMVFVNGRPVQGFPLGDIVDVLGWGPLNGKGWLPWRLGQSPEVLDVA